ncbi:hypothetical protein LCGC14_2802770, partial [marine sediment metagenome]
TVTELERLAFAAEQAGVPQEKFLISLNRFNQSLGEAAEEERKAGKETKDLTTLAGRAREAFDKYGVTVRDAGDAILFDFGRGFGHGVGMCQWGARGKAVAGLGFEAILAAYYPDSKLFKAYP